MKFTEEEILGILDSSDLKYAVVAYKENEIDAVLYCHTIEDVRDSIEIMKELFGDGYTFDIIDYQGRHYTSTEGISSC